MMSDLQEQVDAEVKILLALKSEYKSGSGSDWKPDTKPVHPVSCPPASSSMNAHDLNDQIIKQGNLVRDLKGKKAPKVRDKMSLMSKGNPTLDSHFDYTD